MSEGEQLSHKTLLVGKGKNICRPWEWSNEWDKTSATLLIVDSAYKRFIRAWLNAIIIFDIIMHDFLRHLYIYIYGGLASTSLLYCRHLFKLLLMVYEHKWRSCDSSTWHDQSCTSLHVDYLKYWFSTLLIYISYSLFILAKNYLTVFMCSINCSYPAALMVKECLQCMKCYWHFLICNCLLLLYCIHHNLEFELGREEDSCMGRPVQDCSISTQSYVNLSQVHPHSWKMP